MVEPPPNILSLPQNPRLAWVVDDAISLRGLNEGVGADEGFRFGVFGVSLRDGMAKAFIIAGA